jgi:hypothetical protein
LPELAGGFFHVGDEDGIGRVMGAYFMYVFHLSEL